MPHGAPGSRPTRRAALAALLALAATLVTDMPAAQPRAPIIAVLIHGTESAQRPRVDDLRAGLLELGYREGRDYRLEVRFTGNSTERLPELARELVRAKPAVAVAAPVISAQALQRESRTLPIVMATGAGAQRFGLIESLARPGGNVTGINSQGDELTAKLFELLQQLAPQARRVVALSSGLGAVEGDIRRSARATAKREGLTLIEALAESAEQLPQLAERCRLERCEALVVLLDPNLASLRTELAGLAATLRIPAVYPSSLFVEAGGLIGYGADLRQLYRRAATFVDRILKGAKPGELAIEQPTTFELVVNLGTAKTLGIKVPQELLLRADRVIE